MRLRISLSSVSKALSTSTTNSSPKPPFSIAVNELASFLRDGRPNITVLTGAGVSTDSAIPDYRGENGTYTLNPGYKPIFYQAFVASDEARQRYWARSFLGFPPVMTTQPNPTHYALTLLQSSSLSSSSPSNLSGQVQDQYQNLNQGQDNDPVQVQPQAQTQAQAQAQAQDSNRAQLGGYIRTLITQNVDGLHQKAGTKNVVELHGTLHRVKCMSCGHEEDRSEFQKVLADMNPEWNELIQSQSASSLYTRMNADGDVELKSPEQQQQTRPNDKQLDYRTFHYPKCSCCGSGDYKPSVVFFGENVPPGIKDSTTQAILEADALLVVGTSLTTFSAFRLVKLAKDVGVPIAMINLGKSRGDSLVDLRYEEPSTRLLKAVVSELGLGKVPGEIRRRKRTINVVGS
ncbi:NAD-dependent protein lipoamidase sirtuin-4 [Entomortierella chlamydospora]|uniref:NAD-dependent protein lipoamidase sirtuin-4 n=1 Tax=Entomortierella chlamydospora TaxID=101097 RepID=A0A9P6T2E1_9FUNG|nr:NAD-dependent protein lipoamidase sirtuin-4 [Entomortierella chlamydospora]